VAARAIVEGQAWLGDLQGELSALLAGVSARARSRLNREKGRQADGGRAPDRAVAVLCADGPLD
jgi:hypothetical protein